MKVLLSFLLCLLLLSCQSVPIDESLRDWADVTLRVTGSGSIGKEWSIVERMQAIQRAKVDAYTRLESAIMRLKTDSRKTISELSEKDEAMRQKISAFVRGAKIIETNNDASGVNIVAELFLGENFKATIGISKRRTTSPSGVQRGSNLTR